MNDGLDLQESDGGPFELDDDSTGTWIVVTEDASWYLDLDKHFMIELHRDDSNSRDGNPAAAPRFPLDDEVLIVPQIVVCQVGQMFMVELVAGDSPRPRVAINKPIVAIMSAMSR